MYFGQCVLYVAYFKEDSFSNSYHAIWGLTMVHGIVNVLFLHICLICDYVNRIYFLLPVAFLGCIIHKQFHHDIKSKTKRAIPDLCIPQLHLTNPKCKNLSRSISLFDRWPREGAWMRRTAWQIPGTSCHNKRGVPRSGLRPRCR